MLDKLKLLFCEAVAKFGIPPESIKFAANKDHSISVLLSIASYPDDGSRAQSLICRIGDGFFVVPESYIKQYPLPNGLSDVPFAFSTSQRKIIWDVASPPTYIWDFPALAFEYFLKNYTPTAFGCCHRYTACSDAKKCLHPDLLYSKGCMYRKNLELGNIFYGQNANTALPTV